MSTRKIMPWGAIKPPVGFEIDWSDPINKGIVGRWLFNEGAGKTVYDLVKKNNGAFTTAPTWAAGLNGPAVNFSSDSIVVNPFPATKPPLTVITWIYPTTISGTQCLFAHDNGGNNGWRFHTNGSALQYTCGGVADASSGLTVTANKWNFVALTVVSDGGTINYFVNGTTASVGGVSLGGTTPTQLTMANDLFSEPLVGKMAHASIFSRALSNSEVRRFYTEPFAGILAPRWRRWSGGAAAPADVLFGQACM